MSKVNLLPEVTMLADQAVLAAVERWSALVDFSKFYLAVHIRAERYTNLLDHYSELAPKPVDEAAFWSCLPWLAHTPIKAVLSPPEATIKQRSIHIAVDENQQRWLECCVHYLSDIVPACVLLVREVSHEHEDKRAFQQEKLRAIAYDRFKFSILELVLKEQDASRILEKIVSDIEAMHGEMYGAIVLTQGLGQMVDSVIAPSLPPALSKTLRQLHVAAGNGSLATAIAMRQRVIVDNVMTHPFWVNHQAAAAASGVQSGWAEPILNANGEVLGAFAIYYHQPQTPSDAEQSMIEQAARLVSIVVDRHLSQASIQSLSTREPVTGLANRRQVDAVLRQLRTQTVSGKHHGLIYLDLDHFKWINEAHGHAAGNSVLQQVAERLQKAVEPHFIACMGGDEFLVLLPTLSSQADKALDQVWSMQRKLQKALARPFNVAGLSLPVTASMGLCRFSDQEAGETDYVKAADIAMHKAKQAGRQQACVYEPGMQTEIATQAMLEADLRVALEMQQFRVFYQVQVDHTGRPFGAEVLLRWQHPVHGLISPLTFIAIAESSGLIVEIGMWVLDQACAQIAAWQRSQTTRDLSLSVNISARQFRQAEFTGMVQACIQRHQINPNALRLELTESLLLENVDDAIRIMTELSQLGIQFSLDDFGTGYSSLQYLKKLPLYQLKIDRSFVNDLVTDSHDRTIVRTIIAMAQSMYLGVIAEGVETQAQMELLLNNGCRRYQGYLYGKPMPITEFNDSLEAALS